MLFEFNNFKWDKFGRIERPDLILCNPNKIEIGSVGAFAKEIKLSIRLDDISELTFKMPEKIFNKNTDKYEVTPHYYDVAGKRLIRIDPFGYFQFENPREQNDGVSVWKECKAKSLEAEFMFKNISGFEGTLPLYDLLNPKNPETVLGIVLGLMPSWNIGYVDSKVWDYWRTFKISQKNLYNFIKQDIQKIFRCLFQFDTYNREISVYAVETLSIDSRLSLSLNNVLKSIDIEEYSEDIVTCLEVYGAGDLDIRELNPRGDNKLYNFDYFMNEKWLPDETEANGLIAKWNSYKDYFVLKKTEYAALTVEWRIYNASLLNETAKLKNLEREYEVNKNAQGALIQAGITGMANSQYATRQNALIRLDREITTQKAFVVAIQKDLDRINVLLADISAGLQFDKWFTADQIKTLASITFEDTITADSFVVVDNDFTGEPILSGLINNATISINGGTINLPTGGSIYFCENNTLAINYVAKYPNGTTKNCSVNVSTKNCLLSVNEQKNTVLLTVNVATGTANDGTNTYPFNNGILTLSAARQAIAYTKDSLLQINALEGNIYATEAVTALGRQQVVQELYTYAEDIFSKLSVPSYSFDVDSVNFLFMEVFKPNLDDLRLGSKVSLELTENKWVYPILLQVDINFDSEAKINIKFSNKLRFGESVAELAELLNESISRGKDSTANRFDYNSFTDSGANNDIKSFITEAMNASKNAILSSNKQEIIFDSTGIRLRKYVSDGVYSPEQLWLSNNSMVFTRDGWNNAAAAFGKVNYGGNEFYALNAEVLAGRKILGNEMEIMANSAFGINTVSSFIFNGNGAKFNNATLTVNSSQNGLNIVLDPLNGILMGSNLYSYDIDKNLVVNPSGNKLFWADVYGNLNLKGNIFAENGYFKGDVYARDLFLGNSSNSVLTNLGQLKGDILDLRNAIVRQNGYDNLNVNYNGAITIGSGNTAITINNGRVSMGSGVSVSWDSVTSKPTIPTLPSYIKSTYIDSATVQSPTIAGGTITGGSIIGGTITGSTVQTAASGARIVMNSNGITSFSSSNQKIGWSLNPYSSGVAGNLEYYVNNALRATFGRGNAGENLFQFTYDDGGLNFKLSYGNLTWNGATLATQQWVQSNAIARFA